MKGNLKGSQSERFMMYSRFLQMNQGGKYKFVRLHPLKKFGQFTEIEGVDAVEAPEIPNVFVKEEHDVEVVCSKPSDEDVYVVKLPGY
ncbi:hypothetical protein R6Q57_021545 [Mikania cordata]